VVSEPPYESVSGTTPKVAFIGGAGTVRSSAAFRVATLNIADEMLQGCDVVVLSAKQPYLRLVTVLAVKTSEEWAEARSYLDMDSLAEMEEVQDPGENPKTLDATVCLIGSPSLESNLQNFSDVTARTTISSCWGDRVRPMCVLCCPVGMGSCSSGGSFL